MPGSDSLPRFVAVVPAAGASRRMGSPKLLLPWGERTVVECVVAAYRASRVSAVVVTVAPGDETLAAVCRGAGGEVVVPSEPPPDMKASVQAALAHVSLHHGAAAPDAFLVAPADMPWLRTDVIDRLIGRFALGRAPAVVPTHGGRRGHPVILSWELADEVLGLGDAETLKTVIARHPTELVECDDSVLGDLDTPEAYRAACARHGVS